jgi:hypothetical protein
VREFHAANACPVRKDAAETVEKVRIAVNEADEFKAIQGYSSFAFFRKRRRSGQHGGTETWKGFRILEMLRGSYGLCRQMLRVELLQVVEYQRMLRCVGSKGGARGG